MDKFHLKSRPPDPHSARKHERWRSNLSQDLTFQDQARSNSAYNFELNQKDMSQAFNNQDLAYFEGFLVKF